jgi:hypothetical protein
MKMNDELETNVAKSRYYPGFAWRNWEKPQNPQVKMAGVPAEILSNQLLSITPERYL